MDDKVKAALTSAARSIVVDGRYDGALGTMAVEHVEVRVGYRLSPEALEHLTVAWEEAREELRSSVKPPAAVV